MGHYKMHECQRAKPKHEEEMRGWGVQWIENQAQRQEVLGSNLASDTSNCVTLGKSFAPSPPIAYLYHSSALEPIHSIDYKTESKGLERERDRQTDRQK